MHTCEAIGCFATINTKHSRQSWFAGKWRWLCACCRYSPSTKVCR